MSAASRSHPPGKGRRTSPRSLSLLLAAALATFGSMAPAAPVAAADPEPVIVGNALVDRAYATDYATPTGTLGPVLVVLAGAPVPAGTLTSFLSWNQLAPGGSPTPSAGNVFHALVLRPTATTNAYRVVYRSPLLTVPVTATGEVATFAVPNVAVQMGDLIGFYGEGIPVDTGSGVDVLSYPAPAAPVQGTTISLGSASYPILPSTRTYSFAASVTPSPAFVGSGFPVTPSDLAFILKQIKIAEQHVANTTSETGPCGALLGPDPDQIVSPLLAFGLRTVDGTCNNLVPGQETFGASDQPFPRLTTPTFGPAEDSNVPGLGPVGPPGTTSYAQTSGSVVDSEPRLVSNLIVDQTSANPAAVAAAGFPVRSQGNEGVVPCDEEGQPVGCVPEHETLDIPNITTDVGLSPPFNALFTIFGQFFDHGLDKITNGGNGTVFVPLKADDPLVAGDDHIFGTSDDLPANLRFMTLTRGTIIQGSDGFRNAPNTDTPFVDQSQTYTSHASHQVFTREYVENTAGRPVSTGALLASPDGGLPTWAMLKTQAADLLGLEIVDADVDNIPMIAADPYGRFIPGPLRGLPQYVTASGLVEGDRANPVPVPGDATRIGTAFLNDIAHSAAPTAGGPDANSTAGGSLDTPSPAGTYDDELLDLHFIAGDGRVNENIALTAVHQIFHSEHDRLVAYIQNVLLTDDSGVTDLAEWEDPLGANGWNGERLFQAARFVTEMQYQHLVFEEFARKVQPGIDPFNPFAFGMTDIDPAITAEFAHAVYRFGHSMLTDTIPRINDNGTRNDVSLFDGFLNPAAYHDGGSVGELSSQKAAGSILMGLSDEVGQEIDEFVADTLRNNLLGLPLDLPAINMTRARSEGIPSLNNVRRQIHAATNDGQLTPYTDWVDFGQVLKHPESLVNFVAAYGTHPIITTLDPDGPGPDVAGGIEARRAAADQIVNNTTLPGPDDILGDIPETAAVDEGADDIAPPADNADFMFSTGAWSNTGTTSNTGLDDVDLWVGGLAERTNVFGGLLGSTFNYVFENQLTALQNGDRLYYLARTPGMNLRGALEGNTFGEMILRNTNARGLKADQFATADCKFELGRLTYPASAGSFITGAGSVNDDPLSECDENRLLLRMPDGTFRYRAVNSVDPAGINGQAVYVGSDGVVVDRIYGGNDSDTFWGGEGNDVIQGGDGADDVLGGEGNDVITDLAGDDFLRGGPGNDAIDGGPGLDIIIGGEGRDFINGGANSNDIFAGEGDDLVIGGQGLDGVIGDGGSDWLEGGESPDLLVGDSSTFFFDDHNLPGHDIFIGQGGDDDYDSEGGDDIMVAGPGLEKSSGAAGWDWVIGLRDPQPQDMDLSLRIVANLPPLVEVRERSFEVEALSGWNLDDTLRGDDFVPGETAGEGFIGCDALDAAGVARIAGLEALVPDSIRTTDPAAIIAFASTHHCRLVGPVWAGGNILIGGAGSDTLEGRGADDILDGDRYLSVRLSIRSNPADASTEIGSTDLMTGTAVTGSFGAGTSGMTLQQAVFAGLVDPANIVAVREILDPGPGTGVDVALFSAPRSEYTLTLNANGSVTVDHTTPGGVDDGTDTLWNMEQLGFCDVPGATAQTCAVRAPLVTIAPVSVVAPPSIDFGSVDAGLASTTQEVTVTNGGFSPLVVSGVTLSGTDPASFEVTSNACTTVAEDASCTIEVRFAPTTGGAKSATLEIAHNGAGSPSTVALTGTGVVLANTPASGTVTISDTTPTENQQLTVTQAIVDPDGIGPITFTWEAETAPGTWTTIGTGTTFTPGDAHVGQALRVVASYTDLATEPVDESITSAATAPVANVNDAPVGAPVISDATPTEGQTLTSLTGAIADGDGLVGVTFNYQWQQNNLGGAGAYVNIAGATSADFTPDQAQVNRRLRVVVSYSDNHGTAESIISAATTSVVGDLFEGGAGNDAWTGTAGDDIASGGDGNDTLNGGNGNDVITGGAGDDTVNGGNGNDVFLVTGTGDGFDAVTGGAGTDRIEATSDGTDIGLRSIGTVEAVSAGGFANVRIIGSGNADTLSFAAVTLTGITEINGGAGNDTITGSAAADVIDGGDGNDTLNGGNGDDTLSGGAGDDTLNGGAGADTLDGAVGNDTLNGGAGLDRLIYGVTGFGADLINGFDANPAGGQDLLDVSGLGITAATFGASVTIDAHPSGGTRVTIGADTIRLAGVAPAAVSATDFIVAP